MNSERRRRPVATRVTAEQSIGLPPSDHPIWAMGSAHVRIALVLCDLVALLGPKKPWKK